MLILECSDISSILKTVERNSPSTTDMFQCIQEEAANRGGKSTDFSQGSFDFHISNANPAALARIAVLLLLARMPHEDQMADTALFWAVWGNCLLTHAQFLSFQVVAETLVRDDTFLFKICGLKIQILRFALLWKSAPFVSRLFGNVTGLLLKVCYGKTSQIWCKSGFICGYLLQNVRGPITLTKENGCHVGEM